MVFKEDNFNYSSHGAPLPRGGPRIGHNTRWILLVLPIGVMIGRLWYPQDGFYLSPNTSTHSIFHPINPPNKMWSFLKRIFSQLLLRGILWTSLPDRLTSILFYYRLKCSLGFNKTIGAKISFQQRPIERGPVKALIFPAEWFDALYPKVNKCTPGEDVKYLECALSPN